MLYIIEIVSARNTRKKLATNIPNQIKLNILFLEDANIAIGRRRIADLCIVAAKKI